MSIPAKQLAESFKRFKVKSITKNGSSNIEVWDVDNKNLEFIDGKWKFRGTICQTNFLGPLEIVEFSGKEAKDCIYIMKEPEKWIGKLCWLWDEDEEEDRVTSVGVLKEITSGGKYLDSYHQTGWAHCRPVKPDEVKFVEDVVRMKASKGKEFIPPDKD